MKWAPVCSIRARSRRLKVRLRYSSEPQRVYSVCCRRQRIRQDPWMQYLSHRCARSTLADSRACSSRNEMLWTNNCKCLKNKARGKTLRNIGRKGIQSCSYWKLTDRREPKHSLMHMTWSWMTKISWWKSTSSQTAWAAATLVSRRKAVESNGASRCRGSRFR